MSHQPSCALYADREGARACICNEARGFPIVQSFRVGSGGLDIWSPLRVMFTEAWRGDPSRRADVAIICK